MSEQQPCPAANGLDEPAKPIVYKVYEYAQPFSGDDFVMVREARTYYYLDGRIRHEMLLIETPFEQLVQSHHGDFKKSDKRLTGLFEATDQAKECARKIVDLYGKPVVIRGNQVSMAL